MKQGIKKLLFLLIPQILIFSCGIDKYYYLPQVPEINIRTELNTDATISLPSTLSQAEFSEYAPGYSIYYRIYITDHSQTGEIQKPPSPEMSTINAALLSDFNFFLPFTDPVNYTSIPNANTFRTRNFHELELQEVSSARISSIVNVFSISRGDSYALHFPSRSDEFPYLEEPGRLNPSTREPYRYYLLRNDGKGNNNGINFTPQPIGDNGEPFRYLIYSDDLAITNATENINNDVILRSDGRNRQAYISMYLVSVGANPTNFTRIFSKPTHIGIFRLPSPH